jgi:hypothetical protein
MYRWLVFLPFLFIRSIRSDSFIHFLDGPME